MRCRAVLSEDGSHYVINGKKSWITSGPVAKYIMLFAMTDPDKGPRGVSAFIIDTEREGFARPERGVLKRPPRKTESARRPRWRRRR